MADNGFYPLASGSKGNCIYFQSDRCKLLIDAGISARSTVEHLNTLDVEISEIDAILVTHEHGDHIKGLKVLAYRYGIPVFANSGTAKGILNAFGECPKFKIFTTGETFEFADLKIHPFSIQHDTLDPVGFTIEVDELKIGFCTDLGFVTTLVKTKLQGCDYLYLEANHEPSMVHACARPMVYKQRVLSRVGHLSNEACGQLLSDVFHDGLRHVHLAHLSSECNSEEVALKVVKEILDERRYHVELSIAKQDIPSRPIHFEASLVS